MPYRTEFVEAELFMSHNGVNIYHTYKNDDIEQSARNYWFVLDPEAGEDEAFDVRKLSNWREDENRPPLGKTVMHLPEEKKLNDKLWQDYWDNNGPQEHVKNILREAIEKDLLPVQEKDSLE